MHIPLDRRSSSGKAPTICGRVFLCHRSLAQPLGDAFTGTCICHSRRLRFQNHPQSTVTQKHFGDRSCLKLRCHSHIRLRSLCSSGIFNPVHGRALQPTILPGGLCGSPKGHGELKCLICSIHWMPAVVSGYFPDDFSTKYCPPSGSTCSESLDLS